MIILRIKLASAQVVTTLHGSLLEALGYLRPSLFQVLGQFLLGSRTQNRQSLHRIPTCAALLPAIILHIGAQCVHQSLNFLGCEASFSECRSARLVIVPFPLSKNMRLNIFIELNDCFRPLFICFGVQFSVSFGFK